MRWLFACTFVMALMPTALAQTIRNYEYDALGRLTKVTPGSGNSVCYTFDAADNRTNATGAASCTGGASGGGNSPPDAFNDIYFKTMPGAIWSGYLLVMNNDTDPDLPNDTLTITSVTGSSYASVAQAGASIYFSGPDGDYVLTYTIKDAQNATDSATVNLHVSSLQ